MKYIYILVLNTFFTLTLFANQTCSPGEYAEQGTDICKPGIPVSNPGIWLPSCPDGYMLEQGTDSICKRKVYVPNPGLWLPSCSEGKRLIQGTEQCVFVKPFAEAGMDQEVQIGSTVYLDGRKSSSDLGNDLTYQWSFGYKPTGSNTQLQNIRTATPTFVADVSGPYIVELVVNDGHSDSNKDTVSITAGSTSNTPPVASAGTDQNAYTGASVVLDGSGSSDGDGDDLTFVWSFVSKPSGSQTRLSDISAVKPTFTADTVGNYVLSLIVYDGKVNSLQDTVTISVSIAPPVDNIPPVITILGNNPTVVLKDSIYSDAGATAHDNVDGDIPVKIYGEDINTARVGDEDITYVAIDTAGNLADAQRIVKVVTSLDFIAYADHTTTSDIAQTTTVNVLGNDTINTGSPVTVSLLWSYEQYGGTWHATSNQMIFTPDIHFGGGLVKATYQIRDTNGNISTAEVTIDYSKLFVAEDDLKKESVLQNSLVDVLANDTVHDISSVEVYLNNYYGPGYDAKGPIETEDGNWSVIGQEILFTPSKSFGGGDTDLGYIIVDDDGHGDYADIEIIYPKVFYAEDDYIYNENIEPVTVQVLSNDTIPTGSTPTVLLRWYGQYGPETGTTFETYDGNWSVSAGNTITFLPNDNFGGGDTWVEYIISDQNGYISVADIDIEYKKEFYAEADYVYPTSLVPVSVEVLKNDSYPSGANITVTVTGYSNANGTWSVDGQNNVLFTPNSTFGGNVIYAGYEITDENGRTSFSQVNINYPKVFYAEYDNVTPSDLSPQTVDVLANDIYPVGAQITVTVDEIYGPQGGTWSVSGEDVVFTPDNGFGGGSVYTQYVITDENGRTSSSQVSINYPKEFLCRARQCNSK